MRAAIPLLLVLVACAGCGQKGPLYLRDNPPAHVKPPKPEPYRPVPYPKDGEDDASADGTKK